MSEWVDRHSVTCAICGELADERETVSLWEDDITGSMEAENPELVAAIREAREEYGNGEVHESHLSNQ